MLAFTVQRLLGMLPTALLVVALVAGLLAFLPGDPLDALLGEQATPTDRAAMAAALGLDRPWPTQIAAYMVDLGQGDWGTSLVSNSPVLALITDRLPATVALASAAMGVALVLGGGLGVLLATRGPRIRQSLDLLSLALLITPSFVLGPLLIWLGAVLLGLFPVAGYGGPLSLVLPALTLGTGLGMVIARFLAESLSRTLTLPALQTVQAKGAGSLRRLGRHALPLALGPVVQIVFLQLGMVLTGAVLTEAVFGWPGLGNLLVEALHQRDFPVIQGVILIISITYMLCVLFSDLLMAVLDPRVRQSLQGGPGGVAKG